MVNISGHKVNENQAMLRFHSTPFRMVNRKNTTILGKDVGKKEPSYTASRNVIEYNLYGKQH
jgi:hypothetical protein